MGMIPTSAKFLFIFCCLLGSRVSCHRLPNFMTEDDLSDGQHEIRIHYDGVSAKQTSVGHDQGSESGLVLRQVSRHKHMVTLIYVGEVKEGMSVEGLSLRDCEISSNTSEINDFVQVFRDDVNSAHLIPQGSNNGVFFNTSYVPLLSEEEVPEYLREALHFRELRALCKAHHRNVRRASKEKRRLENTQLETSSHSRSRRWVLNELLIMPGTKWCGNEDLADSFSDLSGYVGADHCCRQHDMCNINIPGFTRKYGIYNSRLTTVSHCACDERSRRSVLDNLRFPATRWCGVGYSASVYGDLGGSSGADKCCRQHDLHCPYYIKSFEKKYGIMNWSIGTINHCACDERFRACLKMSRTGAADMVGHVFFDVVKTRCFVFKKQKVCKKYSWWGRCEKYRIQGVAVLREPIPFST